MFRKVMIIMMVTKVKKTMMMLTGIRLRKLEGQKRWQRMENKKGVRVLVSRKAREH